MGLLDAVSSVVGDVAGGAMSLIGANASNQVSRDEATAANNLSLTEANNANAITSQNNLAEQSLAQQNINLQENLAQNGLSMKIQDAAKYGISPIAAIGGSEPNYSPVGEMLAGPTVPAPSQIPSYTSPIGAAADSMSKVGQDVSRAVMATQSPTQKASEALDLVYKSKQNDLLDVQVAMAKKQLAFNDTPPGMPHAWATVVNRDGTTSVIPSPGVAEANHGRMFGSYLWSLDNNLLPGLQELATPKPGNRSDNSVPTLNYYP